MDHPLNDHERRLGRAVIESYLSKEDLEKMKVLLEENSPAMLAPSQKAAIRSLFAALGYIEE